MIKNKRKKERDKLDKAQKKEDKIARRNEKKRQKASARIVKLEEKQNYISNLVSLESNPRKQKTLQNNRDRIALRIQQIRLSTIGKIQHSAYDNLLVKIKILKRWIIILIVALAVAVGTLGTILVYMVYNDAAVGSYIRSKEVCIQDLVGDINDLSNEIYDKDSTISEQQDEIDALSEKIAWFDDNARIVVADEGEWYKTYHKYDCEHWRGKGCWIHNKEWLANKSEYTKCSYCQ